MYGCSSSGVKLLHDFFKMKRDPTESAADYLQRLGVQISKVARKGGVAADHRDETLLAHFISMCDSEQLRQVLHVKYERASPSQHDLLKEVRKRQNQHATIAHPTASCKVFNRQDIRLRPLKDKRARVSQTVQSPSSASWRDV